MKRSFLGKPYPVITGIMAGQTPQELIAEARNSQFDGAHGIAIDLADLRPEFRDSESLKIVIESVNLPFMFYFYRTDRWNDSSDDERQALLLAAVGVVMLRSASVTERRLRAASLWRNRLGGEPRRVREPKTWNDQGGFLD